MQTVILAGGLGTRLGQETERIPKPMVEIGGRPLLWHIMKAFAAQGQEDFVVALGYRGEVIKRYFADYHRAHSGNMRVDLGRGEVSFEEPPSRDKWRVHLVETGENVMTGGRVARLREALRGERFLLTYGDGVADVDVAALLRFHAAHGKIATVTAVRPPARFGGLVFDGDRVAEFTEKPQVGEGWINGGFMVFEPAVFEWLGGDDCVLEADTLEALAAAGELYAYRHEGFWQCVDTVREKRLLEELWQKGAPWKRWR